MTEIKLTLDGWMTPTWLAANLRGRASFMGSQDGAGDIKSAEALRSLADSIEEQVKPAIEEPTERWSVIKARPGWKNPPLKEFTLLAGGYWVDADGNECGAFSSFSDVEVLRVGIGDDPRPAQDDAYLMGVTDTAAKVSRWLRQLRAEALTAERQNAYDKAIKLVEELQP